MVVAYCENRLTKKCVVGRSKNRHVSRDLKTGVSESLIRNLFYNNVWAMHSTLKLSKLSLIIEYKTIKLLRLTFSKRRSAKFPSSVGCERLACLLTG